MRVEALVSDGSSERSPRVSGGVVNLGRCDPVAVGVISGRRKDSPISQGGDARVPARVRHGRSLRPGLRGRIKQRGHGCTYMGPAVLASENHDPTIGELGISGAMQITENRGRVRRERAVRARRGVPNTSARAVRPHDDLARRQHRHVLALQAPVEDRAPGTTAGCHRLRRRRVCARQHRNKKSNHDQLAPPRPEHLTTRLHHGPPGH